MKKILSIIFGLIFIGNIYSAELQDSLNIQELTVDYDVAVKFINDYVVYCDEHSDQVELTDWVDAREDVSIRFKKELKRIIVEAKQTSSELGLGFDPIFDAQDYPEQLTIESTDTEYVTVKGLGWESFKVVIRLILLEDKWLVTGCGIVNIPRNMRAKNNCF